MVLNQSVNDLRECQQSENMSDKKNFSGKFWDGTVQYLSDVTGSYICVEKMNWKIKANLILFYVGSQRTQWV